MGPQEQRLMDRLFGEPARKLLNFKVWWGDRAHEYTREELCEQINSALDQADDGIGILCTIAANV